jgi:hypothetical protein
MLTSFLHFTRRCSIGCCCSPRLMMLIPSARFPRLCPRLFFQELELMHQGAASHYAQQRQLQDKLDRTQHTLSTAGAGTPASPRSAELATLRRQLHALQARRPSPLPSPSPLPRGGAHASGLAIGDWWSIKGVRVAAGTYVRFAATNRPCTRNTTARCKPTTTAAAAAAEEEEEEAPAAALRMAMPTAT